MTLAGKSVVVLGSSSIGEGGSGTLGRALHALLPHTTLTFIGRSGYGFAGAAANRFAGTEQQRKTLLEELHAAGPADYVLVVMGSNPTGSPVELEAAMRWFATQVGLSRVLWVGPPVYADADSQKITNTYEALGPALLGMHYVSSQSWTDRTAGRTADKVHFTPDGAQRWGRYIVGWAQGQTASSWSTTLVAAVAGVAALLLYLRRNR
jgi:lysophospholipase L1-like esterase